MHQTADVKGHFRGGHCRLEVSPRLISWTEVEKDVWRSLEAAR
jgi:hypothetical protein